MEELSLTGPVAVVAKLLEHAGCGDSVVDVDIDAVFGDHNVCAAAAVPPGAYRRLGVGLGACSRGNREGDGECCQNGSERNESATCAGHWSWDGVGV
jgi:hypothetical protein